MKNFQFSKYSIFFIAISMIASHYVYAEYRVYQYSVKSKEKLKRENQSYTVTSTLDPVAYLSYHGGESSIKIDLLRTWMCPGYTGYYKEICDGPLENLKKLQEAASGN